MATATKQLPQRPQQPVNNGAAPVKRVTLADTIKTGHGLPSRVVLHGQGGIGKTSWAAQAPNPFFLLADGETGLHILIDNGQLPPTPNVEVYDWKNALSIVDELINTDHDHKTLVIDTIDVLEGLCNKFVLADEFNNQTSGKDGFSSFAQGNRHVAHFVWPELLSRCDTLRMRKRMSIIMLAHTTQTTFPNPSGADYARYVPSLYKDVWQATFNWADIVLFGHPDVVVEKEKTDKKAKGRGNDRVFETVWDPSADAKHRHGLPPQIPMGDSPEEAWSNFITALKTGRQKPEPQTTETQQTQEGTT